MATCKMRERKCIRQWAFDNRDMVHTTAVSVLITLFCAT